MPILTSGRSRFINGSRVPPAPVPVAGAERVTDGDFPSATYWTVGTGWTITGGALVGTDATGDVYQYSVGERYRWAVVSIDVVSRTAGGIAVNIQAIVPSLPTKTEAGVLWGTGVLISSDPTLYIGDTSAFSGHLDNASVRLLETASIVSVRPYASADIDLYAGVDRLANTQAGFALRVDDPDNPQNFILVYETGVGQVMVDKVVAGVYTNVLDAAITYGAGVGLRAVANGTGVSVWYNGVQMGATVTVADASIRYNTHHGLFSTYSGNTFTGYVAA